MKFKHLAVIVCVLLALVLVGTALRRRTTPPADGNLAGQVELVQLLDDGFSEEAVNGLILSRKVEAPPAAGGDPSDSRPEKILREVRLSRSDGGEWLAASAFNAPANAAKIKDFLASLRGLRGDLQAEQKTSHAGLGVDADGSLRLEIATKDGKSAILHAGERAGGVYGESYVRREGEDRVYRVNLDVRRSAGMLSPSSPAPAARDWLDLALSDIRPEAMRRVTLEYPEGKLVMARGKAEDGEESGGAWKLEAGGAAERFKPDRLESWASDAAALNAEDAADPTLADQAGMAGGVSSLVVSADGGPDFSLRLWTRDDRHYAVSSLRPNLVYSVTESSRSRIFPPIGEFFAEEAAPDEKEAGPEPAGDAGGDD
ncbi:MAG: DUF4340 domain-containing protein [Planctomycetota bacterium]|jgi:hypothetical protein|nr:DUF4340 domain-containing protein [Planctomycetota bacterium]